MFIIDDILLAQIVLPYGQRLLGQGRDIFYTWVDQQLGKESKKLVRRWRKHNPTDEEVLRDLGEFAERHRETAGRLTSAAFATEAAAADQTLLDADQREEAFLTAVRDYYLAPIVNMARALGRPAVVPGFLTGAGYLAAIDVRTPYGTELELPAVWGRGAQHAPTLRFPDSVGLYQPHWLPRLWLFKATDERRHGYEDLARRRGTTIKEFADAMEGQGLVTAIFRTHIVVRPAVTIADGRPPAPSGEAWEISLARSPTGIEAIRTELAHQLGEQQGEDRRWIQAITGVAASAPRGAVSP